MEIKAEPKLKIIDFDVYRHRESMKHWVFHSNFKIDLQKNQQQQQDSTNTKQEKEELIFTENNKPKSTNKNDGRLGGYLKDVLVVPGISKFNKDHQQNQLKDETREKCIDGLEGIIIDGEQLTKKNRVKISNFLLSIKKT